MKGRGGVRSSALRRVKGGVNTAACARPHLLLCSAWWTCTSARLTDAYNGEPCKGLCARGASRPHCVQTGGGGGGGIEPLPPNGPASRAKLRAPANEFGRG